MALTQTVEYALRAMVWLAQHSGEPQTTQQIAQATRVPASYLPKVCQPLVRAGLITGQRGIRGGYALRRPASRVSLLDVVDAIDPVRRIERCPLGLESHGAQLCALHALLDRILADEAAQLGQVHLSDIVAGRPDQPVALCNDASCCSGPPAARPTTTSKPTPSGSTDRDA